MNKIFFINLFKYIITIPLIIVSISLVTLIFTFLHPYLLRFLFLLRDDYDFWALLGRWGILIICTLLTIPIIFIYSSIASVFHKIICKICPNDNFAKYTSIGISILFFILYIILAFKNTELDLFNFINLTIGSIYLLIILVFVNIFED